MWSSIFIQRQHNYYGNYSIRNILSTLTLTLNTCMYQFMILIEGLTENHIEYLICYIEWSSTLLDCHYRIYLDNKVTCLPLKNG